MSTSKKKDKPKGQLMLPNPANSQQDSTAHGSSNADNGQPRVFVYGSLKTEMGNNALLQRAGAKCLGYDTITGQFNMMSFGGFPGVVHTQDVVPQTIYGEVWATNEEGLAALDMLEGHPRFYERFKFRTDILERRAWMYTLPSGNGYLDPTRYDWVEDNIWRPQYEEVKYFNNREGTEICVA